MNLTIDEIEDVVDGIVVIVDEEIKYINVEFDEFVDKLLDEIQLNDLKVRVNEIIELFENQKIIVEDVNGVIDVQSNIIGQLGSLDADCKSLFQSNPDVCEPLTDISTVLGNINIEQIPLPDPNLEQEIHDIGELFNDVTSQIENINITSILQKLSEEVNSISDFVREELSQVDDIQEQFFRNNLIPSKMENVYNDYLRHVNTGFLSVGGFLAFILTVVLIGLVCGVPQKSSKCGSWSMCSALSVFFIAASFLFLICMALFVVGAFTQKLVCDTLNEPEDSELVPLLDVFLNAEINGLNLGGEPFNLSIPVIINGIHQGLPVYPLMQLKNIYDINDLTNWKEDFNIDSIIDSTMESIDAVISDVTDFESQIVEQKDAVITMATTLDEELNPILDRLLDRTQINQPILEARDQLEQFIEDVSGDAYTSNFVESLKEMSSEIGYLEGNITTVQEDFDNILETFGTDDGNGNRDLALESFVVQTFEIVDSAFEIFPTRVETFANKIIDELLGAVDAEIPNIIDSVNTVGGTQPLSTIYDATYTHVCLEIVSPLNSVWSGLGWTLLLILFPLSLFSCLLMRILRQEVSTRDMRPYQATRTRNISMHDLSPPTYNLAVKPVSQPSQNPYYGNGNQGNRNYNNNNNNMRKY